MFGAVVRGRADLFEERVGQASTLRLMTVASDVDLLAFESPRFYDRLQRVQSQSQFRPTQVVHSLSQLASGLAGSVGVLIALAVIPPLLVPIALLWFLPLLAATHRNVWTNYNFVRGQSQLDRRRGYIANLLTDRSSAKEVRAFGLRRYLLDRYQSPTRVNWTATWAFSIRPAVPVYWRCTPTVAGPPFSGHRSRRQPTQPSLPGSSAVG